MGLFVRSDGVAMRTTGCIVLHSGLVLCDFSIKVRCAHYANAGFGRVRAPRVEIKFTNFRVAPLNHSNCTARAHFELDVHVCMCECVLVCAPVNKY